MQKLAGRGDPTMLDVLAHVYDRGDKLIGVDRVLFQNDPQFVTSVTFRFESLALVFRADAEFDELKAVIGHTTDDVDEVTVECGGLEPWSSCIGHGLRWAWQLTNQQGYTDGVRLEFGDPDSGDEVVVELLVMASMIHVYQLGRAAM